MLKVEVSGTWITVSDRKHYTLRMFTNEMFKSCRKQGTERFVIGNWEGSKSRLQSEVNINTNEDVPAY